MLAVCPPLPGDLMKRDLTPERLRCTFGGCPAVFEEEDGTITVIGRRVSRDYHGQIDSGEEAVNLSPAFFETLLREALLQE